MMEKVKQIKQEKKKMDFCNMCLAEINIKKSYVAIIKSIEHFDGKMICPTNVEEILTFHTKCYKHAFKESFIVDIDKGKMIIKRC
jgi:hypothetical protein